VPFDWRGVLNLIVYPLLSEEQKMRRIIILLMVAFLTIGIANCQTSFDQAVGKNWIGGGDVILKKGELESFKFYLNKGVKYSILIESDNEIKIDMGGVSITAQVQEFVLTGDNKEVTIWLTPSKKSKIVIGLYWEGNKK